MSLHLHFGRLENLLTGIFSIEIFTNLLESSLSYELTRNNKINEPTSSMSKVRVFELR
jgi:hypothetical protein